MSVVASQLIARFPGGMLALGLSLAYVLHAQASGVEIQLHDDGSELLLEIIDNGCGISDEQRDSPQSFGIRGMEERVVTIGAAQVTFEFLEGPIHINAWISRVIALPYWNW